MLKLFYKEEHVYVEYIRELIYLAMTPFSFLIKQQSKIFQKGEKGSLQQCNNHFF